MQVLGSREVNKLSRQTNRVFAQQFRSQAENLLSDCRSDSGGDVRGIYLDCTYVCRVLTVFLSSI